MYGCTKHDGSAFQGADDPGLAGYESIRFFLLIPKFGMVQNRVTLWNKTEIE
jgi:hypothetical protein